MFHLFQICSIFNCSYQFGIRAAIRCWFPTMVTTRSNSKNPDTMEIILEMLMANRENRVAERQQRDAERQQLETRFTRLEAMMENLSKHSDNGTPKGSVNKEETPKNHTGEGKQNDGEN